MTNTKLMPLLLFGVLLLGLADHAVAQARQQVRVWTDQQGRQIEARMLRVQGENVVLEVNGQPTFVPIAQLSAADQAFLTGDEPPANATPASPVPPPTVTEEPRFWQVNGKQFTAVWAGADDDGYVLQTPTGEMRVSYDLVASEDDARTIIAHLKALRRADLIERVTAAYARNTGRPLDASAEPPPEDPISPVDPNANVIPDDYVRPSAPTNADGSPKESMKIATADEAFNSDSEDAEHQAAMERFRTRVLLGGLALALLVAAIAAYSYFSMKRV